MRMSSRSYFKRLLHLCEELIDKPMVAACLYGSRAGDYHRLDSDFDVLAVLKDYSDGIRYNYVPFLDLHASILLVDEELFTLDVAEGSLGEFVAGRILTPYISILNEQYLKAKEIVLKRRICLEELQELIIEHGELSRGLLFRPEFIALSRMRRRMKVYPPLSYSYSKLLSSNRREKNIGKIVKGYVRALKLLQDENVVEGGGYFKLKNSFVDRVLKRKSVQRVVNILEYSNRAIRSYLARGRAGRISLDLLAKELTSKLVRGLTSPPLNGSMDPTDYLYIKTGSGVTGLKDETSAVELLRRLKPAGEVKVKRLGSAINDVFLAEVDGERLVVKKFSDWYVFKWFTLNIVALGSKVFSLSGKERLSNEYGTTRLLDEMGLHVQKVVHLSLPKRILVKEFIPGITYLTMARRYLNLNNEVDTNLKYPFEKIGEFMASIHDVDVTVGDTKPENFLLSEYGDVYALDLEQGRRGGDKAWDVAELVYYSGHYWLTLNEGLKSIAAEFIEGYVGGGGDPNILNKAASLPYLKVFSFWTPLPVLIYLSGRLKNVKE